jgi:serine protease AprX
VSRSTRRPGPLALLGVVVAGAVVCGGGVGSPAQGAVPSAGPEQQAVVLYRGAPVAVPGVRVVTALPLLHGAVVRGSARELAALPRVPGIAAVAPDDAVALSGSDAPAGGGVLASSGLAGTGSHSGRGVRVAVVDTGVSDSAALSRAGGRLVDGVDTSAVTTGGQPRTSGRFEDGYGHGTFMASLIAGGRAPGSGGHPVGVAPGATVVVVKVADDAGTTSLSSVLVGLVWVATHADRVDVANLSFSHVRPGTAYGPDPLTVAVEQVRRAGVTVAVSAGNDASQLGDPGFTPQALTVGAVDVRSATVASFSGSGTVAGVAKPDLVASGVTVLGVLPAGSVIAREHPTALTPGGLWRGSGTSQATAVVSGAAAVLLERHPGATPAQVKATLRGAARDLPGTRDGAGQLRMPTRLLAGPDGLALSGGGDLTGEVGFDAVSWAAVSWAGIDWSAVSWAQVRWDAVSWAAVSWAAVSWASGSWSSVRWDAVSWAAVSWASSSWTAVSWAGDTWDAGP